jgi:hypothetical protein
MIFARYRIAGEHAADGIFERNLFDRRRGKMRATEIRDDGLCRCEKALEIESPQARSVRERRP